MPWVFPLRDHLVGNDIDQMLTYAKELKKLGADFLHVTSGFGFINPKGNPGPFPYDEIRIFCNASRHLSLKAAARATLFNVVPPAIAKPLCNIGWRYEEGSNLPYVATLPARGRVAGDCQRRLPESSVHSRRFAGWKVRFRIHGAGVDRQP
jgi:hypothetical protein